ncbi:MAG: hypothetical protein ACLPX5_10275 [Dissulfurispiraceae bacterium]
MRSIEKDYKILADLWHEMVYIKQSILREGEYVNLVIYTDKSGKNEEYGYEL